MYKEFLLNSIVKDLKICRRLYTRIPANKMDYRPKEGVRSTIELLRYLSWCGTGMIKYWYHGDGRDFKTFIGEIVSATKTMEPEQFIAAMDEQIETVKALFAEIKDEDLYTKQVNYPSGGNTGPLGEVLLETSVKWLAAYKMQLFLYLKYSTDQPLVTADAWAKTEMD